NVAPVGALVGDAPTGPEPATEPAPPGPPRSLRCTIPAAGKRVIHGALCAAPGDPYFTATEMLEDFVSDAGTFHAPATEAQPAESGFERRLRRALGDDYELLEEIGAGGFGRVYRARDLGLEREVAIQVP